MDGTIPKGALTFVQQVRRLGSWGGDFQPMTSFSMNGAKAMTGVVLANPAVADGARPDTPLALFRATPNPGSTGCGRTRSAICSLERSRSA